ncbi:hypothetical protein ACU686_28095 [Yinghuangia aomiensis]
MGIIDRDALVTKVLGRQDRGDAQHRRQRHDRLRRPLPGRRVSDRTSRTAQSIKSKNAKGLGVLRPVRPARRVGQAALTSLNYKLDLDRRQQQRLQPAVPATRGATRCWPPQNDPLTSGMYVACWRTPASNLVHRAWLGDCSPSYALGTQAVSAFALRAFSAWLIFAARRNGLRATYVTRKSVQLATTAQEMARTAAASGPLRLPLARTPPSSAFNVERATSKRWKPRRLQPTARPHYR